MLSQTGYTDHSTRVLVEFSGEGEISFYRFVGTIDGSRAFHNALALQGA